MNLTMTMKMKIFTYLGSLDRLACAGEPAERLQRECHGRLLALMMRARATCSGSSETPKWEVVGADRIKLSHSTTAAFSQCLQFDFVMGCNF